MLERQYTNCINFEHTLLLEPYVEHLLSRHGFRPLRKACFLDDHSIFYAAARSRRAPTALGPDLFDECGAVRPALRVDPPELAARLNEQIADADAPVYLFGAHVFAQYMLAFGLDESRLAGILDERSTQSRAKRLYGSNLSVHAPAVRGRASAAGGDPARGRTTPRSREAIVSGINPDVVFLG